jgi:hypothetical protein
VVRVFGRAGLFGIEKAGVVEVDTVFDQFPEQGGGDWLGSVGHSATRMFLAIPARIR